MKNFEWSAKESVRASTEGGYSFKVLEAYVSSLQFSETLLICVDKKPNSFDRKRSKLVRKITCDCPKSISLLSLVLEQKRMKSVHNMYKDIRVFYKHLR